MADELDFKASDLLKKDLYREKMRLKNYKSQYFRCMNTIQHVDKMCQQQFTTYTVPVALPGDIDFDLSECCEFLKTELRKSEFYVKIMKPGNVLFISWKPEDVQQVRKKLAKENKKRLRQEEKRYKNAGLQEKDLYKESRSSRERSQSPERGRRRTRSPSRSLSPMRPERTVTPPPRPVSPKKRMFEYDPGNPLSNILLRTNLIKDNEKYSHLKSVQKWKKRHG